MFKKIAVASIVLATSGGAFADFTASPYISAGIGVDHQIFQNKANDTDMNFGGTVGLYNIAAGFGGLINPNVYLGGEVFGNTTSGQVKGLNDDSTQTSLEYKTKYTYGISFIPGYMVSNNTMAYARAGVVKSRFNVTTELLGSNTNDEDHNVTGGQFGLGFRTLLNEKVALVGEYAYTDYKSFTVSNTKINASGGQATVGLLYHFG